MHSLSAKLVTLCGMAFACAGCLALAGLDDEYHEVGASGAAGGGAAGGPGTPASAGSGALCVPETAIACYSGPPGTEDVGACIRGWRICNAQGNEYGPCDGEIVPQQEDCATPEDEDCDGDSTPCPGTPLWAQRFGDGEDQAGTALTVDAGGGVVLAGFTEGVIDFGGMPSSNPGSVAGFLARFDADGNHDWSWTFGDAGATQITSVSAGDFGLLTIVGTYTGGATFCAQLTGGGGSPKAFVAQVNTFIFDCVGGIGFGGSGTHDARGGVTIPPSAATYVAGDFTGTIDANSDGVPELTSQLESADIFLIKLDHYYQPSFSKRFGDGNAQSSAGIVSAGDGIILAGSFRGSIDFSENGSMLTSLGAEDLFIAKIGEDGAHQWSRGFGGEGSQIAHAIAAYPNGGVAVAGSFDGLLALDGLELNASDTDAFVAGFDASGAPLWGVRLGGSLDQEAYGVHVGDTGVTVTGAFRGTMDLGNNITLASASDKDVDVFVVGLDLLGNVLWARGFGGVAPQRGLAVAHDARGYVLLTGAFQAAIDLVDPPLISAGVEDVFLTQLFVPTP
jgi:hypothetical protein